MLLTAWCEAVIGHRKMASALLDAHGDRIAMKQSDNRCIVMRFYDPIRAWLCMSVHN